MRPVQLVDGHHDGHHVLAVQDGDGHNALCLVVGQLIHKVAEMGTLRRKSERRGGYYDFTAIQSCVLALVKTLRVNSDEGSGLKGFTPRRRTAATAAAPPEQQGSYIVP